LGQRLWMESILIAVPLQNIWRCLRKSPFDSPSPEEQGIFMDTPIY
jgi:hypothetical protein